MMTRWGAILLLMASSVTPALAADPRLPPPSYPEVLARFEAGEPEAALTMLDRHLQDSTTEHPLEAVIVRARLLEAVARFDEADTIWTAVAARDRTLGRLAQRTRIERLVRRAENDAADAALDALAGARPTRRNLDLLLIVGEAHHHTGHDDRAIVRYRQALGLRSTGEAADAARLGLAGALEASGELEAALDVFREAQLRHRAPDTFGVARAGEQRVATELRRELRPFSEDQHLAMARRLRDNSRFEDALGVLERWRNEHPATRRLESLEAEAIEVLYNQRANDEALAHCQRFVEAFPSSALVARVRLTEFRLFVRLGDTPAVRRLGQALWEGQISGTSHATRWSTGLLLAAYLVSVGEVDDGLDLYRELFRRAASDGAKVDILWRAGVAAVRAGQYDRADTNLRGVLARRRTGEVALAARYWLAITQDRLGRRAEALSALVDLQTRHPFHYYGILAADRLADYRAPDDVAEIRRLRRAAALQPLTFPAPDLSPAARRHADYRAATILARAGWLDEAAAHARRALGAVPRDSALALLAARASSQAGDHTQASAIVSSYFERYLAREVANRPEDLVALAYPRPYWNHVQAAGARHGVDPVLLLSLMRQESRFDPAARSPVGAIGLFQIMPYTADALGPQMGLGEIDEQALMDPAMNAALAARLASGLLDLLDDALPAVIASYNAGEDRASAWWKAARGIGDDMFVDSIPYTETRRFVRAVLTNYHAYRRLYGPDGPDAQR